MGASNGVGGGQTDVLVLVPHDAVFDVPEGQEKNNEEFFVCQLCGTCS